MLPNLDAEQARKRMSNQTVAEYLELSRVSYESKKKTGRFVVKEIKALCDLFGCTFDYLFATEETTAETVTA